MNDYFVSVVAIKDYRELILLDDYKLDREIYRKINEMCLFGETIEEQNGIKVIKYDKYLLMIKDNVVEYMYEDKS